MWMVEWRSCNRLDGVNNHLVYRHPHITGKEWSIFETKKACKKFIDEHYGYIRTRKDLRSEPHGWRMPHPVKVKITKEIK
jgi:hypothetical protein